MKDHVVSHLSPVSLALYRIYRHSVLFHIEIDNDFIFFIKNELIERANVELPKLKVH